MNLDRIGSHSPYYAVIARLDRGLAVITGLDPVIQTTHRRRPRRLLESRARPEACWIAGTSPATTAGRHATVRRSARA
jgi:hypothetical protein